MDSNHYCPHDHDGHVVCEGVEEEVGVQGFHRNSFDNQVEEVEALAEGAVEALAEGAAAEKLGEDMEVESLNFTKNFICSQVFSSVHIQLSQTSIAILEYIK